MKILTISPRIPALNKSGDQLVSYYRLLFLAKTHQVKVLCFATKKGDHEADVRALEAQGITVSIVPWRLRDALWFVTVALFDGGMPFQCSWYTSSRFRRIYQNLLDTFNPDVIYAVTIRPLYNIIDSRKPLYVDLIDSMGLNFARRRDSSIGLRKILLAREAIRVLAFERKISEHANQSFVVSEIDRLFIGNAKVTTLPLGVDLSYFRRQPSFDQKPSIVFSGNMFYKPNIEAMIWFVHFCWPAIKARVPQATLVIAGSRPTKDVRLLAEDASIIVTGRVESMAKVLNASQVAVVPMQSGSGMQNKILEAMACAIPVVATTIGLGDIKAVSSQEILIGDTPEAIVERVVSLLEDTNMRVRVGEAGYHFVLEKHQWDAVNHRFQEVCGLQ